MRTLLLCILGAVLLSTVFCNSGTGPDDCCFSYYPRRVPTKFVKTYYLTDYRCPKIAVIIVTNKSRHICVDPSQPWVEKIMKSVDESYF